MFRNARFFVFSSSSLDLREVRFFKTKLVASGIALGFGLLGLFLFGNILLNDVLGLGYGEMSMLVTENRVLKDQVREMGRKMQVVQRTLEGLAERGNELRVSVDLQRIDGRHTRAFDQCVPHRRGRSTSGAIPVADRPLDP